MKLGVAYNVFDGEELLEISIMQIRQHVDFICVVYQEVSNFGEKREDLKGFLQDLVSRGLVDHIFPYEPLKITTTQKLDLATEYQLRGERNEIVKRNIGKEICRKVGCTHHISLDCDEMFVSEEFLKAKEIIKEGGYDTSYVCFDNYYKKPTLKMKEDGTQGYFAYISFIVKCDDRKYGTGASPVILDPTRRLVAKHYHIFNTIDFKMHHYCYLRASEESFRRKLNNTSFKRNPKMVKGVENVVRAYLNYKEGNKAVIPCMSGYQEKELERVEDKIKADVEKIIL